MSELLVHYFVCDNCGTKARIDILPDRWSYADDSFGNETHACREPACVAWLDQYAVQNGLRRYGLNPAPDPQ